MPSWKDLRRFLKNDGYSFLRSGSKDDIYVKILPDKSTRRVRVSKGTGEISKGLFDRILKQQLGVDKEQFNRVLHNSKKE